MGQVRTRDEERSGRGCGGNGTRRGTTEMDVKRRTTRLGVAAHLTFGAGPVEIARSETRVQAYDVVRRCKRRPRAVVVPHRRTARGSRTISMKIRLGLTFLATGTFLLAVVSACSDDDAGRSPADPTSSATPSAMSPSTSASPTSPSDAAVTAATSLMETYYAVVDELRTDPASDLKKLVSVATSTQLTAQQTFIKIGRAHV